MPVTREAKVTTTRSLNFGSSTVRSCAIKSERSSAAQINTRVNGLSATTASTPSVVRIKVPIQFMGLGKSLRTAAVKMIARHNAVRLTANAQAISSPTNVGDWEKSNVGCQAGNCRAMGSRVSHTKTLIHPTSEPVVAINQL